MKQRTSKANLKFNNYLFFNLYEVGTKARLLNLYKVKKNSYAGEVIGRIYDLYFGNPINYRKEFRRYYKKEFDNCEQYLVCRFNMSEELARKVCRNKKYYVDLEWKGDQVGVYFSYDDELKNQFWGFVGGLEYED